MKSNTNYILLLLAILGMLACRKEEIPPSSNGTPVFMLADSSGVFDITAGANNWYLFTNYYQDDFGVFNFEGSFRKLPECPFNCDQELSIEIRDFRASEVEATVSPEESLSNGFYEYQNVTTGGPIVSYRVYFQAPEMEEGTYLWSFSDGSFDDTPNPVKLFDGGVTSTEVCLTITDSIDCTVEDCTTFNFGANGVTSCIADFDISGALVGDTLLQFNLIASSSGIDPYTFSWNIESNADSATFNTLAVNNIDTLICVTVTDGMGCEDQVCKRIQSNFLNFAICESPFTVDSTEVIFGGEDQLRLEEVKVEYTSPDGVVYRSDLGEQTFQSYFQIIDNQAYDRNEQDQAVQRLNLDFQCMLYDGQGNSIFIESVEGVFGVAYPD